MGGGAIFRSMARLVSTATAAAIGSSTSPSSLAFCRVDPSPQSSAQNEGFSSVSSLSSSKEKQVKALSSSSSSVVVMDDDQFTESCYVREGEESLRRQIFFSPPTAEEVEEATKDLHAALRISLPASVDMAETSFTRGILFDREEETEEEEEDDDDDYNISNQQIMGISRPFAKPSSDIVMPAERSRSVMEAFHLLQTNPKVQEDVVQCLASDQAVWKAMLSNEKLQELANDQSSIHEHSNGENDKHEKGYIGLVNMTSKVYDIVTEKVLGIFEKVLVLLNSIYTSFEKAFLSKENTNALDKTVASCMMLAVAVLLMVFLKRVPK